jgi:hypothetical protein
LICGLRVIWQQSAAQNEREAEDDFHWWNYGLAVSVCEAGTNENGGRFFYALKALRT